MGNSAPPSYSISDLATEFEITTRTIRFYEEKGLLAPKREGSSRIYSAQDRTTLKLILRGKRLGFTLEESRDIINMYDPTSGNTTQLKTLIDTIHEKRAQLEQQLNDINSMMNDLNDAEAKCIEAINDST